MGKEADILAKIVVVEDDVYMREELLNLLEKSGYDTIGLSDFENAVYTAFSKSDNPIVSYPDFSNKFNSSSRI